MKRKHLHHLQLIRIFLFNEWIKDTDNEDKKNHLTAIDNFLGELKFTYCF